VSDRPHHVLADPKDDQRLVSRKDRAVLECGIYTLLEPAMPKHELFMAAENGLLSQDLCACRGLSVSQHFLSAMGGT
jgi:hypothetical protein